jgi:uncharacterized protein
MFRSRRRSCANLPFPTKAAPSQFAGHRVTRGQVREFVVIESYAAAVIGRIVEIQLPNRDRLSVEPARNDGDEVANPIGLIRLLCSVDLNFSGLQMCPALAITSIWLAPTSCAS